MSNDNESSFFIRSMKSLEENIAEIYLSVEPIILVVFSMTQAKEILEIQTQDKSVFYSQSFWLIFFIGLLSISIRLKIRKKDKKLKEDAEKYNDIKSDLSMSQEAITFLKTKQLEDSIKTASQFLSYISNQLIFSSNERLSMYMLISLETQDDTENEEFLQIFGRFSKHYEFNKLNRMRFPKDQGVIGKALINGELDAVFFPDDETDYINKLKDYGILKKDIKKIRMQSKSFYPFIIDNIYNNKSVVVLLESLTPDYNFDHNQMKSLLMEHQEFIVYMLDCHYDLLQATKTEGKL